MLWGSGASAVHFGKNFIKQKMLGTPNTVGVGHFYGRKIQIWKGPDVLLELWCLTFKKSFYLLCRF